jgi:hypothetical protein
MTDLIQTNEAFERIVALDAKKVPHEQIALVLGIDSEKLLAIMDSEGYQTALAIKEEQDVLKYDTLNDGWDIVENLAVNRVIETLEKNSDPDFAMKAATLANKAQRRGKHVNAPLNAQPNMQTIIQVTQNFASALQNNYAIKERDVRLIAKKDSNFLSAKGVQSLLGTTVELQAEKDLADLIPAMV